MRESNDDSVSMVIILDLFNLVGSIGSGADNITFEKACFLGFHSLHLHELSAWTAVYEFILFEQIFRLISVIVDFNIRWSLI